MTDIVEPKSTRHLEMCETGTIAKMQAEIERLRDDYSILKQDYDALRTQLQDDTHYLQCKLERLQGVTIRIFLVPHAAGPKET